MGAFAKHKITFTAYGHANIQARHHSTIEITMATQLSLKGDCIIGVRATQSAQTLNAILGIMLRQPGAEVITQFTAGLRTEVVHGRGAPDFLLNDVQSLVWRTSSYIDSRTIAIRCDKAARDLNREFVRTLQNPVTVLHVTLEVLVPATSISSAI